MTEFLVFNKNFDAALAYRKNYPNLKIIWYDGTSDLISPLFDLYTIDVLIIEDELRKTIETKITDKPPKKILSFSQETSSQPKEIDSNPLHLYIFPSNDTHVHSFQQIYKLVDQPEVLISKLKGENAESALTQMGIDFSPITHKLKIPSSPTALLVANDWGEIEQYMLLQFRSKKIPSFCLQESIIDFSTPDRRMERCDYPLMQGVISIKHLNRSVYFLTGNPRYENLTPLRQPAARNAFINSNFTYGVNEGIRNTWIDDVVSACKVNRLDYLISQHPRDVGDLRQYNTQKSNAARVHGDLMNSSFLITRFSSLIHECLALGRPVIYYNPHKENMFYDFEPDGKHLYIVNNKVDLISTIEKLLPTLDDKNDIDPYFMKYGIRHFGCMDGKSSKRVIDAIQIGILQGICPDRYPIDTLRVTSKYLIKDLIRNIRELNSH